MHTTPVHRRASARWAILATTTVATLTLAACGGGSTGTSAVAAASSAAGRIASTASSGADAATGSAAGHADGTGSDVGSPCNLVSTQQVASILHHDVTNVSLVGGVCFYTDGDSTQALQFATADDANCWSRATGSYGATPVAGVGDAAVGSPLGLDVKHGSTCISVGGGTAAEQSGDFSADVAIAKIVVGKLG